jgi:hypothetical protein
MLQGDETDPESVSPSGFRRIAHDMDKLESPGRTLAHFDTKCFRKPENSLANPLNGRYDYIGLNVVHISPKCRVSGMVSGEVGFYNEIRGAGLYKVVKECERGGPVLGGYESVDFCLNLALESDHIGE